MTRSLDIIRAAMQGRVYTFDEFEPQAAVSPPSVQSQGGETLDPTSFAGTEGDEGQHPHSNPAGQSSMAQADEGSSNPRLTRAAPLYPQGDDTGRIAFAAADHGSSMGIHANTGGENVAAPNKRGDEMKAPARIVEVENVLITATRADAGFGSAVEPGTLYTSPEAPFHSITDWEDEDQ